MFVYVFYHFYHQFVFNSQNFFKKSLEIGQGAASIQERPVIKKYYLTPYFCSLYSRAASNQEQLLMARLW